MRREDCYAEQRRRSRTVPAMFGAGKEPATLDAGLDLGHPLSTPMPEARTPRSLQIVARGLGRLGRERARSASDITPQQSEALQLIADRGVVSTSSLAEWLGIDPSTASRNLAGLERAGYVARRRGSDDGRLSDVRLTPRGKRTAEAAATSWTATYASLLERLPRGERQRVAEALDLLAALLDGKGLR
jgi:DNA-binding MarR family transcriptional regulator